MQTTTLTTNKEDITQSRWVEADLEPLQEGQVRLTIEHFAFTANNTTYAAFGNAMKYWDFFPQADISWGCIPVWGYAVVSESNCAGLSIGDRFYGYYPFANNIVMQPVRVSEAGFFDGAANRAHLHVLYNQYTNVVRDPSHNPKFDSLNSLLRPLFITSFLLDDFFADQNFLSAQTMVLSSASSKTSFGTAYALAQRTGVKPKVIGLTSVSNLAFTERLGLYDEVLTYDQVAQLDALAPTIYLDFSGSCTVRSAVHHQCKGLVHSCAIGATHWKDLQFGVALPGPEPILFFAPAQLKKRITDWGGPQLQNKIGLAMQGFMMAAANPINAWMVVQKNEGKTSAQRVYDDVMTGRARPEIGLMVAL